MKKQGLYSVPDAPPSFPEPLRAVLGGPCNATAPQEIKILRKCLTIIAKRGRDLESHVVTDNWNR